MHSSRRSIVLALGLSVVTSSVCSTARAERTRDAPRSSETSDDYGYVFSDDVMQAGAFTPDDPRITVVMRARRVTLIRPRTAFVAELLRSVESL
jgi:hypothetical protein